MFPICSVSVKRVGGCIIAAYRTEIICFRVHFSVAGKYTDKYKEISTFHYLFMVSHLFWVHTILVK